MQGSPGMSRRLDTKRRAAKTACPLSRPSVIRHAYPTQKQRPARGGPLLQLVEVGPTELARKMASLRETRQRNNRSYRQTYRNCASTCGGRAGLAAEREA